MANADATERLREQSASLEQKVRGQRELLQITESILTTLDPPVLLGTIADRLGELIGSDNVAIELVDHDSGLLTPVVARGSDDEFELVQLFAAQASIALQNAEVHVAARLRAQTDVLTGLLNHGTFGQQL